jgi:hypothetical protein
MFNLLQMTGPIVAAAHYRVAKCILDDMDQTSQVTKKKKIKPHKPSQTKVPQMAVTLMKPQLIHML